MTASPTSVVGADVAPVAPAPRPRVWPFVVATLVFVADQITKGFIQRLPSDADIRVLPHCFSIVHLENTGIAFGLLQHGSAWMRFGLIGGSLAALAVVLVLLWRQRHSFWVAFALALILGGASGNLLDRILRGRVVDFLLVYWRSYSWPAFNVADSAITVGASILIVQVLFERPRGA